jgi:hypothetical protein
MAAARVMEAATNSDAHTKTTQPIGTMTSLTPILGQ